MLELAAKSGCTLLSIGFESISRSRSRACTSLVNRRKISRLSWRRSRLRHHGVRSVRVRLRPRRSVVFDGTVQFDHRRRDYDACAYSVPRRSRPTHVYELKKANHIVSYEWVKYDQSHVVYRPAQMSGEELRVGRAHDIRISILPSIASRFPIRGRRRAPNG